MKIALTYFKKHQNHRCKKTSKQNVQFGQGLSLYIIGNQLVTLKFTMRPNLSIWTKCAFKAHLGHVFGRKIRPKASKLWTTLDKKVSKKTPIQSNGWTFCPNGRFFCPNVKYCISDSYKSEMTVKGVFRGLLFGRFTSLYPEIELF